MKLLFTGASGFLGYNIRSILEKQYEVVHTIGLTNEDYIKYDIAQGIPPINTAYDVVLHAAGKVHVKPKTEGEKQVFFDVNYHGTVNLCKALEKSGIPSSFIFVSSVAVYGCESGYDITEEHPLNGTSPYAKSKIMAEEFLIKWCQKNCVILSILRPSLLAGKNAPGNLGAMVNGIKRGFYLNIAGGKVQRSVLMAEDIAILVPLLSNKGGVYNVCDTKQPTFGQLSELIAKQLGKRKPVSIPYWLACCMAKVGDILGSKAPINSYKLSKMTESLTFSNKKARAELGWEPLDVLANYKI